MTQAIKKKLNLLTSDGRSLYRNAKKAMQSIMKPSAAAKYLCTTSGIALATSYGVSGNLELARSISSGLTGIVTKP